MLLPRFGFENDADRRLIDKLVCGTGAYVERAQITDDNGAEEANGSPRQSEVREGPSTVSVSAKNCACSTPWMPDPKSTPRGWRHLPRGSVW